MQQRARNVIVVSWGISLLCWIYALHVQVRNMRYTLFWLLRGAVIGTFSFFFGGSGFIGKSCSTYPLLWQAVHYPGMLPFLFSRVEV
jgi:hypothetical protein